MINPYLRLFFVFARIGACTFGGGYAMLPVLQREVVANYGWASEEELLDYYAIGQCTPGIIAVNTATFIGYKQKGILGAAAATLGLIAPSMIIILSIAAFMNQFSSLPVMQRIFSGIRIAVCALVLHTVVKLFQKSVKDAACLVIFGFTFCSIAFLKWSPILAVAFSALAGLLLRRGDKA